MKRAYCFLLVILFLIGGCSSRTVSSQPESEVIEIAQPSPPYSDAVWIDTEYVWKHGYYIMVPGHYVHSSRTWIPGFWKQSPKGYRWEAGHWK